MSITVSDSSASSLYRWLAADPDVSRNATIALGDDKEPGGMGGTLEVVNVVLGNAISLSSLLVAIASWRNSRPQPPSVTVEGDGVEIPIEPDET
ncbi:effector-associated constant component EACC1 [Nocardia asiatica]|uniref:effector-associated constant component EACC1 n=1 Tax=Nocardia asiatica TaxID=209252 RepID=UPI003EE1E8A3